VLPGIARIVSESSERALGSDGPNTSLRRNRKTCHHRKFASDPYNICYNNLQSGTASNGSSGESCTPAIASQRALLNHSVFSRVDHRPWAVPNARWTWRQSWCDLLFAHWPIAAEKLQPLVPPPLEVQQFDGTSWVGIVPFRMQGVMRRPLPSLPYFSAFPELNLRLYVNHKGRPGVWFLSLDAANALAVWAARRFFHLPYFHSRMRLSGLPEEVQYQSFRLARPRGIEFEAAYRPIGAPYESKAGSLEHWLTERYCLYAQSPRGPIYRAEVHHHPWPLQPAQATITKNDLLQPHGLHIEGPPPLLHFSRHLDVVIWSPRAVVG
jgi:uncharacterized protein YqjF (DUF2071 family)